jgi:hypothetical protein
VRVQCREGSLSQPSQKFRFWVAQGFTAAVSAPFHAGFSSRGAASDFYSMIEPW